MSRDTVGQMTPHTMQRHVVKLHLSRCPSPHHLFNVWTSQEIIASAVCLAVGIQPKALNPPETAGTVYAHSLVLKAVSPVLKVAPHCVRKLKGLPKPQTL